MADKVLKFMSILAFLLITQFLRIFDDNEGRGIHESFASVYFFSIKIIDLCVISGKGALVIFRSLAMFIFVIFLLLIKASTSIINTVNGYIPQLGFVRDKN